MNKPKIYISSTIYDFKDLRSALKYYLEALGHEVFMSECNDFPKQLDQNSYDNCLNIINKSDYFILLIGGRTGGWFKEQQISITQKEYKTAFELACQNKLKLLIFVRKELWDVKEDRSALQEILVSDYQKQYELSDDEIKEITYHNSKFVNQANFIFSFIEECGKVKEMKNASQTNGPRPLSNWIHQFATFQDIIDALKNEFSFEKDLSRIALEQNLQNELLRNISLFLYVSDGKIIGPNHNFLVDFQGKNICSKQTNITFASKEASNLFTYSLMSTKYANLSSQFLDEALLSGKFLEYSKDVNSLISGILQNSFLKLKENISMLKALTSDDFKNYNFNLMNMIGNQLKSQTQMPIPTVDIYRLFSIANADKNTLTLLISLYNAIKEGNFDKLKNYEFQPYFNVNNIFQRVNNEQASLNCLLEWIQTQ